MSVTIWRSYDSGKLVQIHTTINLRSHRIRRRAAFTAERNTTQHNARHYIRCERYHNDGTAQRTFYAGSTILSKHRTNNTVLPKYNALSYSQLHTCFKIVMCFLAVSAACIQCSYAVSWRLFSILFCFCFFFFVLPLKVNKAVQSFKQFVDLTTVLSVSY